MTIRQIQSEIEKIKKAVKPNPGIGIIILYHGKLRDQEGNIILESILKINERKASNLSSKEIMDIIDNGKTLILIPDNGRDPDI